MSRKRKRILWIFLMVIAGLITSAIGARAHRAIFASKRTHTTAPNTVSSAPTHNTPEKERIGYEVITITRFGFEPPEITRQGGHFFLVIENRSTVRNLTLRLDPEHGSRLIEITQPVDQLNWVDEMRLPPGRYRISTTDQPNRVCQLTVSP